MTVKWTFTDENAVSYTFGTNPNAGGSPTLKKTITPFSLAGSDGVLVLFEGRQTPPTIEWSGVALDEDQYLAAITWFGHRHQVLLTDDLGRSLWIYITEFTPKRGGRVKHPWRMTYTVKAVVLSSNTQNLVSVADYSFETGVGSWFISSGFTSIATSTVWADSGSYSLVLISSVTPGTNLVSQNAAIPITASTAYRVRAVANAVQTPPLLIGPFAQYGGAMATRGRGVQLFVNWYYTDAGSIVRGLGQYAFPYQDYAGLTGPVVVGGTVTSPAMPAGGSAMVAKLIFAYVTGSWGGVDQNDVIFTLLGTPIPADTVYLDSVQVSQ